ncbi:hypothetical protein pb186bvf_000596 [Paramecium bursaria]
MQRPKTSYSEIQSPSKAIVILQLNASKKLLASFPKDSFSDIVIQCKNKRLELQRAHLRVETNYFEQSNPNQSMNLVAVDGCDPDIFEQIMKCFYGGQFVITKYSDLYLAYQVCYTLKCDSLCKQISEAIQLNRSNFTLIFQMSELYQLEELRIQCYEFIDQDPSIFKHILDLGLLHLRKQHKRNTPSDVLSLNLKCFKSLLQTHEIYRQKIQCLSYQEIYEVIKLYSMDDEQIKELIAELIDRDKLNSQEYEQIFHQIAIKDHNEIFQEPQIQTCNLSIKDYRYKPKSKQEISKLFDIKESESYLNYKRVRELNQVNEKLLLENSQLKLSIDIITRSTNNIKESLEATIKSTIDNKVIEKDREVEVLKKELETLRQELELKNSMLMKAQQSDREEYEDNLEERIDYSQNNYMQQTDNKSLQFTDSRIEITQVEPEQIVQSEVFIKTMQQSHTTLVQSQAKRFESDQNPTTLDNPLQLNFFFEYLGVSIYQLPVLQKIYWGSRDGCDIQQFLQCCDGFNDVLVLIKAFDYNNIFGIYIKGEFRLGAIDGNILLLLITQQQVESRNKVILCENNYMIQLTDLIIQNNCLNVETNKGTNYISGAKNFQVDDIEAFAISISNEM